MYTMPPSTCHTCRGMMRARLRFRIQVLQSMRQRSFHPSRIALESQSTPTQSIYLDSSLPTPGQLTAATNFFLKHRPRKAWVANEWRKQTSQYTDDGNAGSAPMMLTPEIAFLGRSNTGKSSLLNALLVDPLLCRVGPKPGKTIAMHAWALARSDPNTGGAMKGTKGDTDAKLTVLDMPGYGHGSRDEWGNEIVKYLKNRRQLKRAFVLLNPKHGIKDSDTMILDLLRRSGISHQIVACKCDGLKPGELKDALLGLRDAIQAQEQKERDEGRGMMGVALNDILAVSRLGDGKMNKKVVKSKMSGVEEVRWAVLRAVGLEQYAVKKSKNYGKIMKETQLLDEVEDDLEKKENEEEVMQTYIPPNSILSYTPPSQAGIPGNDRKALET